MTDFASVFATDTIIGMKTVLWHLGVGLIFQRSFPIHFDIAVDDFGSNPMIRLSIGT